MHERQSLVLRIIRNTSPVKHPVRSDRTVKKKAVGIDVGDYRRQALFAVRSINAPPPRCPACGRTWRCLIHPRLSSPFPWRPSEKARLQGWADLPGVESAAAVDQARKPGKARVKRRQKARKPGRG